MNAVTVPWLIEPHYRPPASVPDYVADPQAVAAYARDGVALLRNAFDDWVEPLRTGLERNLHEPEAYAFPCESVRAGEPGRFFDSYCNWQRIPEYRAFVERSVAAAMAGQFMRAQHAQLFHDHAFVKEPGTQTATPWHQDLPYYCVDGHQNVSIYIALDDIAPDVSVQFVSGSHRWAELFFPRDFIAGRNFAHDDPALRDVPDAETLRREHTVLSWGLAPGDAVLFHFRTLHGSAAAEVRRRRRAFSTRWLGDDMVYCTRAGETSPPYPGIDQHDGEPLRQDWFPVMWRRS